MSIYFVTPGIVNFDASIARRIPVGHNEKRVFVLRFESYNIFNHAEFSGIGTGATYNASNVQIYQYLWHGHFYAPRAYLFGRASLRVLM